MPTKKWALCPRSGDIHRPMKYHGKHRETNFIRKSVKTATMNRVLRRNVHILQRNHCRSNSSVAMMAIGVLGSGKNNHLLKPDGLEKSRGKRVLVAASDTYWGRALIVVGENLGFEMITKLEKKEDRVDLALALTPKDDMKSLWRALDQDGSLVVVNSPESQKHGMEAGYQPLALHTGLAIFCGASMHGFDFGTWMDLASTEEFEHAAALADMVNQSPKAAVLAQIKVDPDDDRKYVQLLNQAK